MPSRRVMSVAAAYRAAVVIALLAACTSPPSDDDTSTSSDTSSTTTPVDPTVPVDPTIPPTTTTSTTTSADESSTGAVIDGDPCSVQVVTQGALFDPLVRGDEPGVFPPLVADALEDTCGCHTLTSDDQNVAWPGLLAPGGTLLVEYADLANGFESTTLGAAIEAEVRGASMPPGSCPKLPEIAEVLIPWLDQGMPDGASFVP